MDSRKHSHAFSLVELLIVVSIMAVLMALILPTIQSARDTIRSFAGFNASSAADQEKVQTALDFLF